MFAENEVSLWQALIVLLGGGGAGAGIKVMYDWWKERDTRRAAAAEKSHTTEREVRRDTIKEYQELVERQDKDLARANERNAKMEADYLERMRAVEQRQYLSEQREMKCQIRLTRAEAHIRNLQYAAKRAGMEFRAYEDDDSQLDEVPGDGKVEPHGPTLPPDGDQL